MSKSKDTVLVAKIGFFAPGGVWLNPGEPIGKIGEKPYLTTSLVSDWLKLDYVVEVDREEAEAFWKEQNAEAEVEDTGGHINSVTFTPPTKSHADPDDEKDGDEGTDDKGAGSGQKEPPADTTAKGGSKKGGGKKK